MTHDQLENYISNFKENQREVIYKQIIDSELLRKAFETSEGKNILNSAVDLITDDVIKIVSASAQMGLDEDGQNFRAILVHGREINTTYKLMSDWAKILIRGGEHREKAEKIK